ncbi:MAG: transglycosylase domain-containing protein [Desulfomonilia bacterium]
MELRNSRVTQIALGIIAFLLIVFAVIVLDAYRQVRKIGVGSIWHIPSKIYSMPLTISCGDDISRIGLEQRLQRLRYRAVPEVRFPGEYSPEKDTMTIFLHGFSSPEGESNPTLVELRTEKGIVHEISEPGKGSRLEPVQLEPELLAEVFDETFEDRTIVSLDQCPADLHDAIIVTEDRRFYEHGGIDFRSVLRALLINLRQGEIVEGGSTITQQVVKNLFLTSERSIVRKARETLMAVLMEKVYSKQEIFSMYINEVYMGRWGHAGIHGMGRASRLFFDKDISDLDLAESALLAGIIRAPNRYSPYSNPNRAILRRNTVLELMLREDVITDAEFEHAQHTSIDVVPLEPVSRQAPFFIDHVITSLSDDYPVDLLSRGGYRIFTTLDAHMQLTSEELMHHVLSSYPEDIEGAVVILDPEIGEIRAMVGGKSYARSQFNRATQIQRHIGSLIKPVVYYSALRRGFTLSTLVEDSPVRLTLDDGTLWSPANYDDMSHGTVTLFEALVNSYNRATVRVGLDVGLENVISDLRSILPGCAPDPHPSILLGALACSPLDVANLYSAFATGGFRIPSSSVRGIMNENGTELIHHPRRDRRLILDPSSVYLVDAALREVVISGTARDAQMYGMPEGICGKTGTTNEMRDSWFVGFSPDMTVVVWLGDDSFRPIGYSGATGAMPIASMILKRLCDPVHWEIPEDIVLCRIDPINGKRAGVWTKNSLELPFIRGTEPLQVSQEGVPGLIRFFKSLFGKKE